MSGEASPGGAIAPSVGLVIPDGWMEIDLDPATRNASIDALVRQRLRDDAVLAPYRERLVRTLRAAAARCRDAGGVGAFLYHDVDEEPASLLAASLMLTMHRTEGALTIDLVESELARVPGAALDRVATPAGEALRVTGIVRDVFPGEDEPVEVFSARYFVPFEPPPWLVVLSFGTPNLRMTGDFVELFDAMVETLELRAPAAGAPS